jgi:hypothetical protein
MMIIVCSIMFFSILINLAYNSEGHIENNLVQMYVIRNLEVVGVLCILVKATYFLSVTN